MEDSGKTVQEDFFELEKQCIGYENGIDCDDKSYKDTLEKLRQVVIRIQKEHIFSDNE